eukprot:CAMPEP_0119280932 /NCGR_PEP_ID=MMETSP1329-20130426/23681_1 /TAXON_ID=114041 /ORGANISM="Genus nov. species nov., Strain RCC1024" /LENGTH=309 /DNA_ID=CAMNT_0007281533 /DNA_START=204 /DNA_END=1129 /DNA_ORIENTATION=+
MAAMVTDEPAAPAAAFPDGHAKAVAIREIIKFEDGGLKVVLLGTLDGRDVLLDVKQRAAILEEGNWKGSIHHLALELTNYSGAEYSYYAGHDPISGANYDVEAIWPASARQVQRKRPSDYEVMEETPELYRRVAGPFARAQALDRRASGWIDKVCSLEYERERNLVDDAAFVINVDTKWTSHGDFASDRASWRGAPWTSDLYLLAISKDPALVSLRDLRGPEGAALVRRMRDALRATAAEVYGVPATKLRVFFHYQPQFYRLHAHCARAEHCNPGTECDRAHLLTTVAGNLDLHPDYYAAATLTYRLRV